MGYNRNEHESQKEIFSTQKFCLCWCVLQEYGRWHWQKEETLRAWDGYAEKSSCGEIGRLCRERWYKGEIRQATGLCEVEVSQIKVIRSRWENGRRKANEENQRCRDERKNTRWQALNEMEGCIPERHEEEWNKLHWKPATVTNCKMFCMPYAGYNAAGS